MREMEREREREGRRERKTYITTSGLPSQVQIIAELYIRAHLC